MGLVLDQSYIDGSFSVQAISSSASTTKMAMSFTSAYAGIVSRVDVFVKKIGTPVDDLYIEIWSDDGTGKPSALVSDTQSISKSLVTSDPSISYPVFFNTRPNIAIGQKMHIVYYSTIDGVNFYQGAYNSSPGYSNGNSSNYNGAAWSSLTGDFKFYEYATVVDTVLIENSGNQGIDLELLLGVDGTYDIDFDDNGDFKLVKGFDTAILMSILCEQRANNTEVTRPEFRRGDWSNELNDLTDYEVGSKLWLSYQSRANQETLNKTIEAVKAGSSWLVEDQLLKDINVTGSLTSRGIQLVIEYITPDNLIEKKLFNLWELTPNS